MRSRFGNRSRLVQELPGAIHVRGEAVKFAAVAERERDDPCMLALEDDGAGTAFAISARVRARGMVVE
ncbi:MAG: hypothetical protein ACREYF_19025 [Gammaproteobacteria bacterium]